MNFEKPIKEGDIVDVTIESTGAKGDGIAKINNFVVIIPDVREGDHVKVKITRVLKKMAFAEKVEDGAEEEQAEEPVEEEQAEEEPVDNPVEEPAEEEQAEEEPVDDPVEEPAEEEQAEETQEPTE